MDNTSAHFPKHYYAEYFCTQICSQIINMWAATGLSFGTEI